MFCTVSVQKVINNLSKSLLTKTVLYRLIVFSVLIYLSISNYYLSQQAKLVPASSISNSSFARSAQRKIAQPVRVYKNEQKFSLQSVLPVKFEVLYRNHKCTRLVNWIVTTLSKNQTVSNVDYLLKYARHNFCILVLANDVGKAPKWVRHKRVIYLNAKQQASLPFELATLSLHSEYHSRNLGFLYAIQNGAQTITDLDRYSIPTKTANGQFLPMLTEQPTNVKVPSIPATYNKKFWGPFSSSGSKNIYYENRTCLPLIQMYGVAARESSLLEPLSIPPSMYAAYNSHSTVYLYNSFWSLLIPQGLEHAISWRSLVAQHHLHQLPGTCAVFMQSAIKVFGLSHQKDFLSQETYPLVADILDVSRHRLFYKMSLYWSYIDLYEHGFAEEQDIDYSKAWLSDLKKLGYTFPSRKWHYNSWASEVQLCIMFNLMRMTPNEGTVNMILRYYLLFFSRILIIFDGEWADRPKYLPSSIGFTGCNSENGKYQHICLNKCMHYTKKRASGYLYIADDMWVNLTMMSSLSPSKIWYIKPFTINYTSIINDEPTDWHWGHPDYYEYALKAVIDTLPSTWMKRLINTSGFPEHFSVRGIFDVIYIPKTFVDPLSEVLSHIISTADLFCELAGPLAVEIVAPQSKRETLIYGYLWREQRSITYIMETTKKASFVHPIKLAKNKAEARLWQNLMEQQLFSLLGVVY